MAITVVLSEIQRDTLAKVCDTFAPRLERDDDPTGFWARAASDLAIPDVIEQQLALASDEQVEGFRQLLDAFAAQGFNDLPLEAREQVLHAFAADSPEALAGVHSIQGLTLLLFYAIVDPSTGRNPNWDAIGYPGPVSAPPDVPKPIRPVVPEDDTLVLEADVVVVGSGAGGGVIAGELSKAGKRVAVLEMGGYYNEADFNQLEIWAYENLYRGGGITTTDDGGIALMAGSNLGGGTTVNWTNCLRTTPQVREQWETEHGLEGLAGSDYDRHLDAVWERTGVNDSCSDYNGPHQRLADGCEKLGYPFKVITRNTDPSTYDARVAGLLGFGDQSGSKQGTLKTYLMDAAENGAQFVVRCRVERVLVSGGRAVGVEGTYIDEDGRRASVRVQAPVVVCAGGSLETPALLLRSGIGGPAVGQYLRLHPASAVNGVYGEAQKAWWGAPQAALTDQFADVEDGYGFLVECGHASPGVSGSALPWETGADHKEWMSRSPNMSGFVFLIRDRGHGRVTIDRDGNAVHSYRIEDELDERIFRQGIVELARLHEAAGAEQIFTLHRRMNVWTRGEDLDAYLEKSRGLSIQPHEHATFALHQMGSARMGNDPATSVAGPWGELHDVKGVWIGDASAFPTSTGTNPMVSTMALAHRTAEAIAAG